MRSTLARWPRRQRGNNPTSRSSVSACLPEHALGLIGEIVSEASCPVIAILHAADPEYVRQAARRGVFAYIIESTPEELRAAIEITLERFGEFRRLQGAFGRRALIERGEGGILKEPSAASRADAALPCCARSHRPPA